MVTFRRINSRNAFHNFKDKNALEGVWSNGRVSKMHLDAFELMIASRRIKTKNAFYSCKDKNAIERCWIYDRVQMYLRYIRIDFFLYLFKKIRVIFTNKNKLKSSYLYSLSEPVDNFNVEENYLNESINHCLIIFLDITYPKRRKSRFDFTGLFEKKSIQIYHLFYRYKCFCVRLRLIRFAYEK